MVQALPVLRLLKLHMPQGEFYWWISEGLIPLLDDDPDLAGVFPFQRNRWMSPEFWWEFIASIRRMRNMSFDWVIDLQSLARSGAVAWLARGRLKIGLDDSREGARGFYDIAVSRPSYGTHAVEWYLEVLRHLRIPIHWDFDWIPVRVDTRRSIDQKWNPEPGCWIVINPGARWQNKRWPVQYFRELADSLIRKNPWLKIAILGQSEDTDLGAYIAQDHPDRCLNLAGRTSLPEMVEWIRLSQMIVTNDTGPMHVGAALGKPVIAIFGPTEPKRTGPFHQLDKTLRAPIPCAPCLKSFCAHSQPLECLNRITPERVFNAVQSQLSRS